MRKKNRKSRLFEPLKLIKKYGPNGLWGMRTDHAKTFKNEKGETTELKTAAVILENGITLKDPAKLEQVKALYNENIKNIPSNRPITVTKVSENGIPIEGHTPKKTKMYCESTTGVMAHFYNRPPREKLDQSPKLKKDFHKSIEYQTTPAVTEPVKEQCFALHKHSHSNPKKRTTHPMKISADAYSSAAGYSSPSKPKKRRKKALTKRTAWDNGMEWGHLKDHASFGDNTSKNMGIMRFSTNTRMILSAKTHRKLASKYGKALANVQCPLKTDGTHATHIVQRVNYHIAVKDVLHLRYALKNTRTNPHTTEKAYSDALDSALMNAIEKPAEPIAPVLKGNTAKKRSLNPSREEYLEAVESTVRRRIKF